jgi:hypothetical protein
MKSKAVEQTVPKWFKGQVYEEGDKVINKFSGDSYELTNIELSMYDFIMGSQIVMEMAPKSVTQKMINEFHKALTWFRRANVDAYYVLLD